MLELNPINLSNFFIAGINYKKTDANLRGQYAINKDQYQQLIAIAPQMEVTEFFILSTCNRTEIYGFANQASSLSKLLCTQTAGSIDRFNEMAYVKKGDQAIEHFFIVAAGLDSQILGDYEIVGQIKQAVKFSKDQHFIGTYLDRLVNDVLQCCKSIRTSTALSGGTVSVSFAAVQYIKQNISSVKNKKILLLGTGKIGRNTCKNLVAYLETKNVTLINRTEEKSAELANELGLQHAPMDELTKQIHESAIILVATNADQPIITAAQLINSGTKLIIDLSIPYNVEKSAEDLPNITLINVDALAKIKDETLHKREAEIPKAKNIIAKHIQEFMDWYEMRKNVPVLKAVKHKLEAIESGSLVNTNFSQINTESSQLDATEKIQKVINVLALKMRNQNFKGCNYIEAINEYIAIDSN